MGLQEAPAKFCVPNWVCSGCSQLTSGTGGPEAAGQAAPPLWYSVTKKMEDSVTFSKASGCKVEGLDLNAEVSFRAQAWGTEPLCRLMAEATFWSSRSSHPGQPFELPAQWADPLPESETVASAL